MRISKQGIYKRALRGGVGRRKNNIIKKKSLPQKTMNL
jgi:hypothetical protein